MLVALALEEAANKARAGFLTEALMRKTISETVRRLGGEPPSSHTVADWCRSWVADKKLSKATGTAARYGPLIEDFLAHLGRKAHRDISHLVKADIQSFRDRKVKSGLSGDSVNLALKTIRTCLKLAIRQELITTNPADAVDLLPGNERTKEAFTREQVRRILSVVVNDEWRGLIKLGYYVGARLGDCARMKFECVDFDAKLLTYTPAKQLRGKKLKSVRIPIHPELMRYLETRRKQSGFIFPRLSTLKSGGKTGLSLTFRSLMDTAGITCSVQEPQGKGGRKVYSLGFHSLRRAFNTDLANSSVSQEIRQRLIGHASEEVNDRYTSIEMTTFKDAIEKLESLEGGTDG